MDARVPAVLRLDAEAHLRHGDFRRGAAARLRRLGGKFHAEGNEPLEGDEPVPAQREQPQRDLAFEREQPAAARGAGEMHRLGVLQDVARAVHLEVVLRLGSALCKVRAEQVDGLAAADEVAVREIVEGLLAEHRDVRADERRHEEARPLPAHEQEIAAASTKKAPPSEPVSTWEEPSISSSQSVDISNTAIRTAPASTEGLVNWCSQSSNVRVQSNAPFKNLMAYKAENLIDGKTDSIAAANAEEDGKSWFSIDFGKNTEKTISMIVFRIPPYSPMLGKTSNFRIRIANSNNDLVAEKNFHTDGSAVVDQETWVLDAPVQARGLRIESLGKNQPLIIADLEVYGKP